jgi:hypothetical protein
VHDRGEKLQLLKGKDVKKLVFVLVIHLVFILNLSCNQKKEEFLDLAKLQEVQRLIDENKFEAARITAIETLDPELQELYYQADDALGHASHLDVRCNERIAEILYDIVKKVPAKDIRLNRYIYFQLTSLYPENEIYKKKFIFYDRKVRNSGSQ